MFHPTKKQMFRLFLFSVLALLTFSCQTSASVNKYVYEATQNSEQPGLGSIRGNIIYGDTDEPAAFAKVYLIHTQYGALTDIDGNFIINGIKPGKYNVAIDAMGYNYLQIDSLEIKPDQIVTINEFVVPQDVQIELLKPMIYLYPEETTEVSVQLDFNGELAYTYPKYNVGWKVTANPDGNLIDASGRSYYGLFWEGPTNEPLQANTGFVVASDSIIPFLEDKLYQLGLNDHEANEFIVFWYPILSKSPYNIIHFAEDAYTDQAVLNIDPKPETMIRIMMVYQPLKKWQTIPTQTLPKRPNRKGFTVVEWGGSKADAPSL